VYDWRFNFVRKSEIRIKLDGVKLNSFSMEDNIVITSSFAEREVEEAI